MIESMPADLYILLICLIYGVYLLFEVYSISDEELYTGRKVPSRRPQSNKDRMTFYEESGEWPFLYDAAGEWVFEHGDASPVIAFGSARVKIMESVIEGFPESPDDPGYGQYDEAIVSFTADMSHAEFRYFYGRCVQEEKYLLLAALKPIIQKHRMEDETK